jgi:hypothetical protein
MSAGNDKTRASSHREPITMRAMSNGSAAAAIGRF